MRIKQQSEQWISSEVLNVLQDRNNAFNTFKQNKSGENYKNFKRLRHKAQYVIHKAKQNFFTNILMTPKTTLNLY